ncbi:rhodanese-like domain-containing protein [Streptomyces sp. NPDC001450]
MSDDRHGAAPADGAAITPRHLKRLLDQGAPIDLVDIREPQEWEIVRIPGARLVPMREWLDGSALSTLCQGRTPVFYCRTGRRTLEVLAVAREAGFADAVHLEGGVVAWVNEIDPRLPVY